MHQPRPHGTFGTEGDEDAAALEMLARRLTNAKDLSGLSSLRMSRTLPSGAMAIAQDMGGIFKVIVQAHPQPPEQARTDGLATTYIPALFSGVIKKAVVRPGEGVEIALTEQARRRLSGYLPDQDLPPKNVKLQRFRVRYNVRCDEFNPKNPGELLYTQYAAQRPTWYSGAMAEVMQILGGYGIQDFEELPKDDLERAHMVLPPHVQLTIEDELGNKRLPGYTGIPDKKGEFQYDYKYNDTNGVGFDSDKRPWLLRINTRGVFAMPLPLVPATTVPAFRAYMEEVEDDEMLWALDRFGGLPSGEGMPIATKDFEAWRRAGVIIKVCDVGDFYDHLMYSSACGWSFNSKGTEGFNTCYDYDDNEGIGFGLAYKLSLRLEPTADDGRLPFGFDLPDPSEARVLDAYMSSLYRRLGAGGARERAIKHKLFRSLPQVLARMGKVRDVSYDPDAEADYWDNLEAEPIATHSGSVSRVGRGWLYHGAKFDFQPQIKFPEPFEGGCISHDFLPLINGRGKAKYPRCDTIMFGYYIGDQLKVVKYFRDDRTFKKDRDNDFGECMTVGSWEHVETFTPSGLMGNIYTSDFDDREEGVESKETTKIIGTDLGYDHTPFFEFDGFFQKAGTLWRKRYFRHVSSISGVYGYSSETAACIPYLCRNAVLYASRARTTSRTESTGSVVYDITDPYSYRYWTYDFVYAWAGGVTGPQAQVPVPKDGNPVWVVQENYDPGPCSDFANEGRWIPGLPADYTWLIHPNSGEWRHKGGGGPPLFGNTSTYKEIPGEEEKSSLRVSIINAVGDVNKSVRSGYFVGSPAPYIGVFYCDAARVLAGKTVYANVSEDDPEAPKQRKRFGFTRLADHKSAHHFIGVINE